MFTRTAGGPLTTQTCDVSQRVACGNCPVPVVAAPPIGRQLIAQATIMYTNMTKWRAEHGTDRLYETFTFPEEDQVIEVGRAECGRGVGLAQLVRVRGCLHIHGGARGREERQAVKSVLP